MAGSRKLQIAGTTVVGTPLLLPSYSSRALSGDARDLEMVRATVARTLGLLVGPVLVSAYDLDAGVFASSEEETERDVRKTPLTFIDSGGYENLRDPDARWTRKRHSTALRRWPARSRAVMVGFDVSSPDAGKQIEAAASLLPRRKVGRELLLKPVSGASRSAPGGILDLVEQLRSHPVALACIDVVGVTEKEAGATLRERLETITRLRRALDVVDVTKPLHVFGGLDPVLTPLYFLAGGDIFDGLSWLRYAFVDDRAEYLQPFAALAHRDVAIDDAEWLVRKANLGEIVKLQTRLARLVLEGSERSRDPETEDWLRTAAEFGIPNVFR